MANCTVSFTVNTFSRSEEVEFVPFPDQLVSNVGIDVTPVTATASGNIYSAVLIQGVKYYVNASRFPFHNSRFVVPASSSANLYSLLDGSFRG